MDEIESLQSKGYSIEEITFLLDRIQSNLIEDDWRISYSEKLKKMGVYQTVINRALSQFSKEYIDCQIEFAARTERKDIPTGAFLANCLKENLGNYEAPAVSDEIVVNLTANDILNQQDHSRYLKTKLTVMVNQNSQILEEVIESNLEAYEKDMVSMMVGERKINQLLHYLVQKLSDDVWNSLFDIPKEFTAQ